MAGVHAGVKNGDDRRAADADGAIQLVPADLRQRPLVTVGGVGGGGLDGTRAIELDALDLGVGAEGGQLIGVLGFVEEDAADGELWDGALVGDANVAENLGLAGCISPGGEGDDVGAGAGVGCRGRLGGGIGRRSGVAVGAAVGSGSVVGSGAVVGSSVGTGVGASVGSGVGSGVTSGAADSVGVGSMIGSSASVEVGPKT